jgi:hypothetical protein
VEAGVGATAVMPSVVHAASDTATARRESFERVRNMGVSERDE